MVTPPVEVITTTIATCGWSRSTSTRWMVRGLDRRRRDEREQVGDLRELLGGRAHGVVDLAAHRRSARRGLRGTGSRPSLEQLVDVVAVAAVGGHAAGRGVRVLEQAGLLEPCELGADRGRPPGHVVLLGDPLGADRLVEVDVGLDDLAQDEASVAD